MADLLAAIRLAEPLPFASDCACAINAVICCKSEPVLAGTWLQVTSSVSSIDDTIFTSQLILMAAIDITDETRDKPPVTMTPVSSVNLDANTVLTLNERTRDCLL